MSKEYFQGYKGQKIAYLKFNHNKPNVKKIIFIHGMFESIELYEEFGQYFFEKGYDVYIPEYMGNGELRNKEYTDFGENRIEGVLTDMNQFIHQIFESVSYNDIILMGQGIGANIAYYLLIDSNFKNLVISSMFMENLISTNTNIALSKVEESLGVKESKLNKYYFLNKKYIKEGKYGIVTSDPSIRQKLKNDEKYNISASPMYFNDILRLLRFLKKNFKNIRDDVNILNIYGANDTVTNNEKIKKYLIRINNKIRNINIFKNNIGRNNNILEINRIKIYEKIDNWIKEKMK